jgi:hypothetical protein
MERETIEFDDVDLRSLMHFEEVKEQKFDKDLVKALMTLATALVTAIVGMRCLIWLLETVLIPIRLV